MIITKSMLALMTAAVVALSLKDILAPLVAQAILPLLQ